MHRYGFNTLYMKWSYHGEVKVFQSNENVVREPMDEMLAVLHDVDGVNEDDEPKLGGADNEEYIKAHPLPSLPLEALKNKQYWGRCFDRKRRRQIQRTATIISGKACMAGPHTHTTTIRSSRGGHSSTSPRSTSKAYDRSSPHTFAEDRPRHFFIPGILVGMLVVIATSAKVSILDLIVWRFAPIIPPKDLVPPHPLINPPPPQADDDDEAADLGD
ncbi:hypothetical protein TIFTF001_051868 [Ficus carica]|uniref:Uncharacterized protein n=1 Tax=Ficus carica TaxID=3494 RepID=A0AA88EBI9_FICCA|nr:hypothetical protein TIFTF001_051868 [Ficus carica]